MKVANIISTYWMLDAKGIIDIREKLGSSLGSSILVSKDVAKQEGIGEEAVYFDITAPVYIKSYMARNGEILTHRDMTEEEAEKAVDRGACLAIMVPHEEKKANIQVTLIDSAESKRLLRQAFVNLEDVISNMSFIIEALSGIDISSCDVIHDIENMQNLDLIDAVLTATRTVAERKGRLNLLEVGMSDTVIDNVVAEMNANYVYSALK